jgi:hypothetical protein
MEAPAPAGRTVFDFFALLALSFTSLCARKRYGKNNMRTMPIHQHYVREFEKDLLEGSLGGLGLGLGGLLLLLEL